MQEQKESKEHKVPDWPYYTDPVVRKAIDDELEKMQTIESNLGLDSTPKERAHAKGLQAACMKKIWHLDIKFYNDRINPKKEL